MKKYLTVTEVENLPGAAIWALNGSAQSEVGQAGDVHVGIPKVNGSAKIDALYLPQTFLPFCLTEQIPRAQLLASSEFRSAVNSNLLVLITQEYAEYLLSREGVEEEKERLLQLKRQVREATAARSITASGADVVNTAELNSKEEDEQAAEEKATGVSPSFSMFAQTLVSKNDIEVCNSIRGRGRINRKEANYLLKLLSDKPKTVEMLNKTLAKA